MVDHDNPAMTELLRALSTDLTYDEASVLAEALWSERERRLRPATKDAL